MIILFQGQEYNFEKYDSTRVSLLNTNYDSSTWFYHNLRDF